MWEKQQMKVWFIWLNCNDLQGLFQTHSINIIIAIVIIIIISTYTSLAFAVVNAKDGKIDSPLVLGIWSLKSGDSFSSQFK